MADHPKIGVGTFIRKNGQILVGRRKNAHGAGYWGLPGGHLEFGESWEECAKREVEEETGLKIDNPKFLTTTNDIFTAENKHYNTIFMIIDVDSAEPQIMEPNKCEEWRWVNWDDFNEDLFLPLDNLKKRGFLLPQT